MVTVLKVTSPRPTRYSPEVSFPNCLGILQVNPVDTQEKLSQGTTEGKAKGTELLKGEEFLNPVNAALPWPIHLTGWLTAPPPLTGPDLTSC